MMLFHEFQKSFVSQGYFTPDQVLNWQTNFDKNNFSRWVKTGLIIKLRNGYYTFPENLSNPNINFFLANRIYRPSYISLHSALSFYGLIPESITQTISVSSLKTMVFQNPAGTFSYKSIKPSLMFGFDHLPFINDKTILLAKPEKAILDLLYLYPFYRSENDMTDLRLDRFLIEETINKEILQSYASKFKNIELEKRLKKMTIVYAI